MREILFGGKRKDNGEWVYGDLIHRKIWSSELYIIRVEDSGFDSYTEYEVIPETIGQYTGLTDKNGNKIFEGDIVVIDHTINTRYWEEISETYKPRRSHSLAYDEEKDLLTYKRNYAVEWKEKDARWILRNGSDQHDLYKTYLRCRNGIIIGNIHDNPELLKGGEQK